MNSRVQAGDPQSGLVSIRRSRSVGGIEVWGAWGASDENNGRLSREMASAAVFITPGICSAEKLNPKKAQKKEKQRSRCMSEGSFAVLLLRTATTAMLSEWKQTCLPVHRSPQTAAANTTGTSSLAEMCTSCQSSGHSTWNQPTFSTTAPQPNVPDASENTWLDAVAKGKKEVPFQCWRRHLHHAISALAPADKWTWWWGDFRP